MIVTEESKSPRRILCLVDATVALHNVLMEAKEIEKQEWIDSDDFSAFDDPNRSPTVELSPLDVLNQAVPQGAPKDERRRRLVHCFEEHYHF